MSKPKYCPHFATAFTVCGFCKACAPDLHGNYERAFAATTDMCDRFERETGKSALSAWSEFEAFVDQQPDVVDYAEALFLDSKTDDELQALREGR